MKMLSFLGETPTIALQNAQKECGSEAVVISTKKISSKDKNSENMYEITIALEEEYDNKKSISKKKIVSKQPDNKNVNVQFYPYHTDYHRLYQLKYNDSLLI
jgi:flagellar biosynthesis protein FlhF